MVAAGFHQRFVLCTGAVLLLHVAALASLQGAPSARLAPAGAPGSGAVQARWLLAKPPEAAAAKGAAAAQVADKPSGPDAGAAAVPTAPTGPTTAVATEPVPRQHAAPAADAADYLPRPLLDRAPVAAGPIAIDYPPIAGDAGHYRAVLALFIDETGRVRRVRAEGHALPAPLEKAARSAFLDARFRPGEVEGRAVRSLIRVEVSFDHDAAR